MRNPATLRAHPSNARRHPDAQIAKLAASIDRFGFTAPVLVDRRGRILAGHARVLAARRAGLKEVPTLELDLRDGDARAYLLADNRIAADATWDHDLLRVEIEALRDLEAGADLVGAAGFDPGELDAFLHRTALPAIDGPAIAETNGHGPDLEPLSSEPDPLDAEVVVDRPTTRRGDLWALGRHRVLCGDCTGAETVHALLGDGAPTLILTDPPYCSGSFQESLRAVGSIGTKRTNAGKNRRADSKAKQVVPVVANDALSTRGYQALLSRAIELAPSVGFLYVFTDWKMWLALFDVVERTGFGVRSMIVWDKGSAGMGMGWRAQHELVMWGARSRAKFDGHKAAGNVLRQSRQKNEWHYTQKPVEILRTMLVVADFAPTVYDPFLGSGSTLIACEAEGRTGFGMELDPKFVDAAVLRWQAQTGLEATLATEGSADRGRTFAALRDARKE